MEFFKQTTQFDFIGQARVAYVFSTLLILASVASLILHGGPKYGIDFIGGALIQVKFQDPVPIGTLRASIDRMGAGRSDIQEFGSPNDMLIHLQTDPERQQDLSKRLRQKLTEDFGEGSYEVERIEMVGPKVGKDLREKAVLSVVYAILGILVYISWRFEFRYAVASVVALIHDTLITIGAFSITDKEFTLTVIAAFLTIIGYSLNDTIVVFDRIRENLRVKRALSFDRLINASVNETLSRTILTGGTTLLVVTTLFILGGEVIHDFAFALIVGIVIGTYSSIFVASPIVLHWNRLVSRFSKSRARPVRG
jgi:preprotein translocase subunit SecF